ncbi:MAG: dihydrofolate reductase [Verrucomicrobiota bacterium]
MSRPRLIAVVAMAENRVIGKDGVLPWHLPEDLKFFKRTTTGGAILFGRTTYEGIGKALPNRTNYILSRNWEGTEDVTVIRSLDAVRELPDDTIYICGGAEVYRQFFPICDELLLTRVQGQHEGDTYLPEFEPYFELAEIIERGDGYQIERLSKKN